MEKTKNESRLGRFSHLLKGGARPRRSFALMMALVLVGMLSLAGVVSADNYYAGTPPVTGPMDSVTGDVDMQFSNTWSTTNDFFDTSSSSFTLQAPATGKTLKFARLYVVPYAGSMSADYFGNLTVTLSNNGGTPVPLASSQPLDRSYNNITGTSCNSSVNSPLISLCRVTSDYVAVFDVTNYISSPNINVGVTTYNITRQFDGRIKQVALVYGWDDSSSSKYTQYWVNEGQDPMTKYIGTYTGNQTAFTVDDVPSPYTAKLWVNYLATSGGSGSYTWDNGASFSLSSLTQGTYAGIGSVSLNNLVQTNNVLTYSRTNDWYKNVVDVLTVKEV
jgi:hypothetical protein